MTGLDPELEYNNRRRIPDLGSIAARWKAVSDAYRQVARAELDCDWPLGGGHLTAAMLGSRWDATGDLPGDLVRNGVAISGIFDLEPLIDTTMNQAVRLDREAAPAASPRFWPGPSPDCMLVAAVGALESREFRRQSREMVDHWGAHNVRTQYLEVPESNHFTVLDQLTRPGTTLHTLVLSLARDLYPGPT